MGVVMRSRHSWTGLALAGSLHLFLLYFLLAGRPGTEKPPSTHYSRLVFIVAPQPIPVENAPDPPRMTAMKSRPGKPVIVESPVVVDSPPHVHATPSSVAQAGHLEQAAPLNIDNLVRQAGKADRETRSGNEMQRYGPVPDSMEAVMKRAFTAAKLAVPPKWYEAARIELVSAPNERKRIYQVITAFGTYCLFYPDYVKEPSAPPKMSSCPRNFGPGAG
jgi:hypothetical protein